MVAQGKDSLHLGRKLCLFQSLNSSKCQSQHVMYGGEMPSDRVVALKWTELKKQSFLFVLQILHHTQDANLSYLFGQCTGR